MASHVKIWNITDETGSPHGIDIYKKRIEPGESLDLPADLVDEKIRGLEEAGSISIGALPTWYERVKAKKKSQGELSHDEVRARFAEKPAKKTNGHSHEPAQPVALSSEVPVGDALGMSTGEESSEKKQKHKQR